MISFIFHFSSVNLSIAIVTQPFDYTHYITLCLILASVSSIVYMRHITKKGDKHGWRYYDDAAGPGSDDKYITSRCGHNQIKN